MCLSEGRGPEKCGFDASAEPTVLEEHYRQLAAENPAVCTLDLDALACPGLPRCDAIVDGTIEGRLDSE